jgi:predicted DNA-binding transcriptional regulator AlpA
METDDLMTPDDLGLKFGKSLAALAQWRYQGLGPRFIKLGRNVRYRVSDVEAWLDQQTVQRTGQPGHPATLPTSSSVSRAMTKRSSNTAQASSNRSRPSRNSVLADPLQADGGAA